MWEAVAEIGVAAWALQHAELVCNGDIDQDPVIDLTMMLGCGPLGIEVKRDHAPIEHEILHGRHANDKLALGPGLREKYPGCIFTIEWHGRRPSPAQWGPMKAPIYRQAIAAMAESDLQPEHGRELRLFVQFKGEPRFHFTVRVSLGVAILGMNMSTAGDDWGYAADQVVRHANHKAGLTSDDFMLAYFSIQGESPTVTAHRLAWAWGEIEDRAPDQLLGVVIVHQVPDEDIYFGVTGRFRRDADAWMRELGCHPLPATWEQESAGVAWAKLLREIRAAARKHGLTAWSSMIEELESTACDAPTSGDLYARAVVAASDAGLKIGRVARPGGGNVPFPTPSDTPLHPYPIPRRRR